MSELPTNNLPPAPEEQERIKSEAAWVDLLRQEMARVIVGQKYLVDRLIVGLLANGHVLLEGVPGLAKTLAVKTLAQCMRAEFKRIQFTPDLLPADVVGTLIYSPNKGEFTTKKGPIFANLLLADEINRAPAKVQSALLEGMQERQVTIGDETFPLPQPFLVLATENPIDQEGTYPLPEAQMDRFMLKLLVDYPDREEELKILEANANVSVIHEVNPVVDTETYFSIKKTDRWNLLGRQAQGLSRGRSPRHAGPRPLRGIRTSSIHTVRCISPSHHLSGAGLQSRCLHARQKLRHPQDIKDVGLDVLRHRVIVSYEAEAESVTSDDIVKKIFETVPVP